MTTDFETRLGQTFRDRAPVEAIDTADLLGRAQTRGRRLARRRRIMNASAVAGALAVVLGVSVAVAPMLFGTTGQETPGNSAAPGASPAVIAPSPDAVPMLPSMTADDLTTAKGRPGVVGSDPTLLHFTVKDAGTSFAAIQWSSRQGLEIMQFTGDDDRESWVTLSRTKSVLDAEIKERTGVYWNSGTTDTVRVGPIVGELRTIPTEGGNTSYLLEWQPANGVWANVHVRAGQEPELWRLVERVDLGVVQQCAAPVSPGAVPDGMRLTTCSVTLTTGKRGRSGTIPWFGGALFGYSSGKASVDVVVEAADSRQPAIEPPAGSATSVAKVPQRIEIDGFSIEAWSTPVDQEAMKMTLDGLLVAKEPDDARTWPSPVR